MLVWLQLAPAVAGKGAHKCAESLRHQSEVRASSAPLLHPLPCLKPFLDAAVQLDSQTEHMFAKLGEVLLRARHADFFGINRGKLCEQLVEMSLALRAAVQQHLQHDRCVIMPALAAHFTDSELADLVGRIMGDRCVPRRHTPVAVCLTPTPPYLHCSPSELMRVIISMLARDLPESDARIMIRCMCHAAAGTKFESWLRGLQSQALGARGAPRASRGTRCNCRGVSL